MDPADAGEDSQLRGLGGSISLTAWPFVKRTRWSADGFIDAVLALGPDLPYESDVTRADYAASNVRGTPTPGHDRWQGVTRVDLR
ncbi:hypothetical protein ACIBCL_25045 [Micromonospora zamorensis]|uniref:hypothetical protein n=1 Tax=Micromonospora zamorensis TaxID=709883 RepID=UPI0037AFA2E4